MKKEVEAQLTKKGWSSQEIKKADDIISSRELCDKSRSSGQTNMVVFWSVFLVMIIGNMLIALVLIPILLMLPKLSADAFVIIVGLTFGLLFNFLVWNVENIPKRYRTLAATIIPLLAVIDIYAIVKISNVAGDVFSLTTNREDPMAISAFYVIAFLLPYLWTVFAKQKIKRYEQT